MHIQQKQIAGWHFCLLLDEMGKTARLAQQVRASLFIILSMCRPALWNDSASTISPGPDPSFLLRVGPFSYSNY